MLANLDDLQPVDDANAEAAAWNERLNDSREILETLAEGMSATVTTFGCFFEGEPVGLAAVSPVHDPDATQSGPSALCVHEIVSHPLSRGVGGALIEYAACLSEAAGFGGKLVLAPISDAGRAAYAGLGFVDDDRHGMSFDPVAVENQERWMRRDDGWKLKKYQTKDLASRMSDLRTSTHKSS